MLAITIALVCTRCRKLVGTVNVPYTERHKTTRGDIERRMAEHPPFGYAASRHRLIVPCCMISSASQDSPLVMRQRNYTKVRK